MIVVRTVFHARFGKGGELAEEFKSVNAQMSAEMGSTGRWRVLTDLSGPFDTVVGEIEVSSLAEWEESRAKLFQTNSFRESFGRIQALVVDGRNELWTLEAEA
jgi:hypothetical protein